MWRRPVAMEVRVLCAVLCGGSSGGCRVLGAVALQGLRGDVDSVRTAVVRGTGVRLWGLARASGGFDAQCCVDFPDLVSSGRPRRPVLDPWLRSLWPSKVERRAGVSSSSERAGHGSSDDLPILLAAPRIVSVQDFNGGARRGTHAWKKSRGSGTWSVGPWRTRDCETGEPTRCHQLGERSGKKRNLACGARNS
jgi:hypothetical protein